MVGAPLPRGLAPAAEGIRRRDPPPGQALLRADALPPLPDRAAQLAALRRLAAALGADPGAAPRQLRLGDAAGARLAPPRPRRDDRALRRRADHGGEILRPHEIPDGGETLNGDRPHFYHSVVAGLDDING